jgi:hypothetical protein
MLAEAAMTGKPVYIYALPENPLSVKGRRKNRIARRALRLREGSQRSGGREGVVNRLCALLIAKGLVRPPRDLHELHGTLIRAGIARRFGEPLDLQAPPPWRELELVVHRVQSLLQAKRRDQS